jgi:predicted metalloprotease with PDZ domain
MTFTRAILISLVLVFGGDVAAQQRAATPAAMQAQAASAPISNVRYELTFNSATARERDVRVAMTFDVSGTAPVILSLPVWTPGAYEVSYFAKNVLRFAATSDGRPLDWDKTSYSAWRITPGGARSVRVTYDFRADSLDNAMAWSKPDFLLVNGTNVFMYPAGASLDFSATVSVTTEPGWKIMTGMTPAGTPGSFREANYHDLVDMPFFIGAIDVDSAQSDGKWNRLASYPVGRMDSGARSALLKQIADMSRVQAAVFGETPWQAYTTLLIFDEAFQGGSALEHQNSHVGIYNPGFIGNPILPLITGHEIFHAWNVKRMRPSDLWPYDYTDEQPSPWLWVSEGITDYYADLSMTRGGVVPDELFYQLTAGKISTVSDAVPIALEDASLSNWIHPKDGTDGIYYPKGSLAGFMLDIIIRDATDNRRSLDDVMRDVYQVYKQGRGFTAQDWWGAVARAAGGTAGSNTPLPASLAQSVARTYADFNERYIDGRDPYPWAALLPLAGMRIVVDTIREPRVGLNTAPQPGGGTRVVGVQPGSMAAEAGVQAGDVLISLGDITVRTPETFGADYRRRYATTPEGTALLIVVRRGEQQMSLQGRFRQETRVEVRLEPDPAANEKAVRIREGIIKGPR